MKMINLQIVYSLFFSEVLTFVMFFIPIFFVIFGLSYVMSKIIILFTKEKKLFADYFLISAVLFPVFESVILWKYLYGNGILAWWEVASMMFYSFLGSVIFILIRKYENKKK